MKIGNIVGVILGVSSHLYGGSYVVEGEFMRKGEVVVTEELKGYFQEWEKGVMHQEGCLLQRVAYSFQEGVEVFLGPPLTRYHKGKEGVEIGLGDMDIGGKLRMYKLNDMVFGLMGFVRLPTGSKELPSGDDWAPRFSNGVFGRGVKVFGSYRVKNLGRIDVNVGVLQYIGDVVSEDNPIPYLRGVVNVGMEFPLGLFLESELDVLPCKKVDNKEIPITQNPKRIVVGLNYFLTPKLAIALTGEVGTWGTGDPPLNLWHKGFSKEEFSWVAGVSVSHYPMRKKVDAEKLALQQKLKEREELIKKLKKEKEKEREELVKKIQSLEEELQKERGKAIYKYKTYIVKKGDCLWNIARKEEIYGKGNAYLWHFIYHQNREKIKNPHRIFPGLELKILELPKKKEE